MIRIGMISFAHMHAYSYADCLQQLSHTVDLVGVFDEDPRRGGEAARRYGVPFYSSCDELLRQKPDGVLVCSENAKHLRYTELAASAKTHVLCEKPISVSIADGKAMIDVCQSNGVQLMIAFPCRFSTPILRARQLVVEGRLGRVLGVKGTNRGTMPGGWFVQKELSGGGAIIDHTVHVVDVWRWMLGCEVTSVFAESGRLFYDSIDIEDTGLLSIEFENGVFGSLDTSWSRPNASFPTWGDVTMEIVAEQGSIELDAFKQRISVYNNDSIRAEWACWGDPINLGLVRAFVKSIQTDRPVPVNGYDGFKAMEVALGAYRSVELGKPVELPLNA